MATATLTSVADLFGVGTTVGAYVPGGNAEFPVVGAALATAVVASDGSLTFTGLADDTAYVAYDPATGRRKRFRTPAVSSAGGTGPVGPTGPPGPPGTPGAAGTLLDEGAPLVARSAINFTGAGVTAADDPANARTNVTVAGGVASQLGPMIVSAIASGTADQTAALNAELSAQQTGGGERVLPPGSYRFSTHQKRSHSAIAIPGETAGQVDGSVAIPANVSLTCGTLPDATSCRLQFDTTGWPSTAFAIHLRDLGGSNRRAGVPSIRGFNVATLAAAPVNVNGIWNTGVAPTLPRAILCDNGGVSNLYVEGQFRCAQFIVGDHFNTNECQLFTWAAIEQGVWITQGDNQWWKSNLSGGFCGVYVEAAQFGGVSFWRCHLGLKQVAIYVRNTTASFVALNGIEFIRTSFEGGGRAHLYNPSATATFQDLYWYSCYTPGSAFDGSLAPTDVADLQPDCLVKAKALIRCNWEGGLGWQEAGWGPNAAVIIADTVTDCDLGDITGALGVCKGRGVPFIRGAAITPTVHGVRAKAMMGDSGVSTPVDVTFVRLANTGGCAGGDIIKAGDTTFSAGALQGRVYDVAGAGVVGVALLDASSTNETIPVATAGSLGIGLARSGRGFSAGSLALPNTTPTGAGTAAVTLALPQGGAGVPQTLEKTTAGDTTLRISQLGWLAGLTAGGSFHLSGVVYTYTGIAADATAGGFLVSGISPTLPGSPSAVPVTSTLSPVLQLGSAAEVSSFGGAGGFRNTVTGQRWLFRGKSGAYLHGIQAALVQQAGASTNANATLTGFATTSGIVANMVASGPGVVAGSKVLSTTATTVTLDTPANATNATGTYTFGGGTIAATQAIAETNSVVVSGGLGFSLKRFRPANGSIVVAFGGNPQASYVAFIRDEIGQADSGFALDLTQTTSVVASNSKSKIAGGSQVKGATAASTTFVAEELPFPTATAGVNVKLLIGGTVVTATAYNRATSTVTLSAAATLADGAPVTLAPGQQVTAVDKWVRPFFNTNATDANDAGVAAQASGIFDATAPPFAYALRADEGSTVFCRLGGPGLLAAATGAS